MHNLKHFIVIIFTISLIIYPLVSCANEVNKPQEQERLPSGHFIMKDMRWVQKQHRGHNYWEDITDPETGKILKRVYKYWTYTTTFTNRQISENRCELYSIAYVTEHRTVLDYVIGGDAKLEDSTWTENYGMIGWITIEGNRVYWQSNQPGYDRELLYNFDLKVGEVFYAGLFPDEYKYPFVLTSIDSVLLLNGEHKKSWNFECEHYLQPHFCIIEGIGALPNLTYPIGVYLHHDVSDPVMLKIYYKDKLIWGAE